MSVLSVFISGEILEADQLLLQRQQGLDPVQTDGKDRDTGTAAGKTDAVCKADHLMGLPYFYGANLNKNVV